MLTLFKASGKGMRVSVTAMRFGDEQHTNWTIPVVVKAIVEEGVVILSKDNGTCDAWPLKRIVHMSWTPER